MKINTMKIALLALLLIGITSTSCKNKDDEDLENSEILIDQVEITAPTHEIAEGDTLRLKSSFSPLDATIKTLKWSSDNEEVATIDSFGLITAQKEGLVRIKLSTLDSSRSDIVEIKVIPLGMTFETDTMRLGMVGNLNDTIYVEYKPDYNIDRNIEWISTDETVATVNNGVVTAVSYGETKIIATYRNTKDTCIVVVAAPEYGDYYYSDGSYSKDLKPRRYVTGFVVWVGNPTLSDLELAKDYPNCTHGLVLARTYAYYPVEKKVQNSQIQWSKEWESSHTHSAIENAGTLYQTITATAENGLLNKISGYSNSKVLMKYNQTINSENRCIPMDSVNAYSQKVSAPSASSGWYLPSIKELSYILSGGTDQTIVLNKETMNVSKWSYLNNRVYAMFEKEATDELSKEKLSQINGVEIGRAFYLWSSNEYDSFIFYNDNTEASVGPIGMGGYFGKMTGTSVTDVRTVRAMLAF